MALTGDTLLPQHELLDEVVGQTPQHVGHTAAPTASMCWLHAAASHQLGVGVFPIVSLASNPAYPQCNRTHVAAWALPLKSQHQQGWPQLQLHHFTNPHTHVWAALKCCCRCVFAAFPVLQQPRLRLRHLQAVALHTFSPPLPLPRHAQLLYEVSLLPAGAEQQQQQLVYVSEQVRRSSSCIAVLWFLHHCERLGQLTDFALW